MAPNKRTPERRERILELLRTGNYMQVAAELAGISKDTLYEWIKADADFADAVKEAQASAEALHISNISRAAFDGTWQASAWWLERRFPDRYGRQDRRPEGAEKVEITLRFDDDASNDQSA